MGKRYKKIIILPTILSFIGLLALVNTILVEFKESSSPPTKGNYLSPLPEKISNIVRGIAAKDKLDLPPFPDNTPLTNVDPEISAQTALSVDLTTNKIIYARNIYQRRPIASTLKIMTAILALENSSLDEKVTISQNAATVGEDSMAATAGEKYTMNELLHALLLLSANDAAEAISESVFNRREIFISMMNSKADELGLKDTKFVNPSGLDGDGEHYSTAADLLQMSRYAMKNPTFKEIVKTKEFVVERTDEHKGQLMINQTNLVGTYPGVEGIKTGFTYDAGLCLVTYAKNYDHEIIAIVLGSTSRREDMKKLLDLSYKTLGYQPPKHD